MRMRRKFPGSWCRSRVRDNPVNPCHGRVRARAAARAAILGSWNCHIETEISPLLKMVPGLSLLRIHKATSAHTALCSALRHLQPRSSR
jgi:hypothetical protein